MLMMWGRSHRRSGFAQALAAMALLAMALRALIPAGYMLAPENANGRFVALSLCSGHGQQDVVLDLATGELVDANGGSDDPQDGGAAAPCVFAAVAPLAAPEAAPALIAAAPAQTQHLAAPRTEAGESRLAAPPPWATGPPRSV